MHGLAASFTKMNGLGNDFVIVDARQRAVRLDALMVSMIANRKTGIGCDQVVALEPSDHAGVFMRIWNADGSEVAACGNASRCVASLLASGEEGTAVAIETRAGLLHATVHLGGMVTVDMGVPRLRWADIPLARPQSDTRALDLRFVLPDGRTLSRPAAVNVGNPHCIFWVADVASYDFAAFGQELEHHDFFPERANISLAETATPEQIKLRVWERGAGLTRACGTAACAAAVAGARTGRTGRTVQVALPGGSLFIEWRGSDDHIFMTGPSEREFDGNLTICDSRVSFETRRS